MLNKLILNINYLILILRMNQLPEDIINLIHDFVNPKWLSYCNKDFYNDHFIENLNERYARIYSKVDFINENYIRYLVRNDLYYPFSILHLKRMNQWGKIRHWKYKKKKYKTYFEYLKELCNTYGSGNCLKLLKYN